MDSRFSRSSWSSLLITLLIQCSLVLAQDNTAPKERPLQYTPSKLAAIVAGSMYMFTGGACMIWMLRHWGRYMLALIIGAACYAAGLFLRIIYANDIESTMKYATMNLIILLSPCAFIACVYMMLSRLAIHLDATDFLLIPPRILTKIFVISDVGTFFVQAAGGGMTAGDNLNMRKIGKKVFLCGLVAQLISFLIYTLVFAVFVYRMWSRRKNDWTNRPHGFMKHWVALIAMMGLSCQNIIVRAPNESHVYAYELDRSPRFVPYIVLWRTFKEDMEPSPLMSITFTCSTARFFGFLSGE
ncbi:Protein RTM1 [Ceratobasidium theobromae]|uniref:Protein RTM1 n=1 Tax=Ceratobasidium theobromae TaxID=1582974 RepID=A0A5N5QHV7_9AGAM|nr:Protein RTM1 [Ceratobasidium theobromae]